MNSSPIITADPVTCCTYPKDAVPATDKLLRIFMLEALMLRPLAIFEANEAVVEFKAYEALTALST